MKVITYQSPMGATIDISPAQEREMLRLGIWPRDSVGQEYCSVSHGLHRGTPSAYADEMISHREQRVAIIATRVG